MINFIHDIIKDPREYWPFLLMFGGLIVIWSVLCVSGVISLRASTRRRRFWFAFAPILFGLIGVLAQIPIKMESEDFRLSFDFRWLFLIPLFFGVAGIALCWRARHESAA